MAYNFTIQVVPGHRIHSILNPIASESDIKCSFRKCTQENLIKSFLAISNRGCILEIICLFEMDGNDSLNVFKELIKLILLVNNWKVVLFPIFRRSMSPNPKELSLHYCIMAIYYCTSPSVSVTSRRITHRQNPLRGLCLFV